MSGEHDLASIHAKVDQLMRESVETRDTMKSMAKDVAKLGILEERQGNDREALARAFSQIAEVAKTMKEHQEAADVRLKKLEEAQPANSITNKLVMNAVWLVLAAVMGATVGGLLTRPQASPPIMINGNPNK